jgi:hypothetical protein
MATNPISAISSSSTTTNNINNVDLQQNTLSDNSQLTAMLMSGNIDPKFASLLLSQMYNNNVNTILFGSEDTTGSSSTGNIDIFDSAAAPSSNFNVLGQTADNSGISPQYQMSVYSSLIGKTITATQPLTNGQITGKVTAIQLQNGQVMLNVSGTLVPTTNILKIQ